MSLQIQLKKSAVTQKQPFASDLAVGELALNYNADGPFLTCKDTAGNVRKLNHVWVATTAPTGPSAGDLWLDTSAATAVLKVYKDSSATWVNATSIPLASTSVYGTVQLATSADITNGAAGKVVDAAQLQSKVTTEITAALSASPTTIQNLSVANNATISGNLTVNGTTTTIDTTNLLVEDKNIEMGVVATPTNTTADGGGITLRGTTNKTLNWVNATGAWTSSERFSVPLGTAAAPSITLTGDPNTGIYSPGADQLALSTNGTGRLFVNASGRVGVGTASPSEQLHLTGSLYAESRIYAADGAASTPSIRFYNSNVGLYSPGSSALGFSTGSSERLRITSAGLVGIGTSTPSTLLDVRGSDSVLPAIRVGRDANAYILRANVSEVADFGFVIEDTSGNDLYNVQSGASGFHRFFINNSEVARITSAGLVGIGTSAPSGNLHVSTSGRTLLRLTGASSNTSSSSCVFETTDAGSNFRGTGCFYYDTTSQTEWFSGRPYNGSDAFAVNRKTAVTSANVGDTTAARTNTLFLIDSAGNVGIGTTSPQSALDIHSAASTKQIQWTDDTTATGFLDNGTGGTRFYTNGGLLFGTGSATFAERARIDSSGRLLVGTSSDSGGALLQVNGDRVRIATAKTPASASATGTAGEVCWDTNYIYVCTATNTWKRAALSTW